MHTFEHQRFYELHYPNRNYYSQYTSPRKNQPTREFLYDYQRPIERCTNASVYVYLVNRHYQSLYATITTLYQVANQKVSILKSCGL